MEKEREPEDHTVSTRNPEPPNVNSSSLAFVEDLYLTYLRDASRVPEDWRAYFDALPGNGLAGRESFGPNFPRRSIFRGGGRDGLAAAASMEPAANADVQLQHRVDKLVRNFRVRGHRIADVNPLGRDDVDIPELTTEYYDFREADLARPVLESNFPNAETLEDVLVGLRETYCRSIGAQFMHIDNLEIRTWLQERMERSQNRLQLPRDTQVRILTKLTDAIIFEDFIQKKYVGAKSFSLEGGETLIPLLDRVIEKAGRHGIEEIVLGMAHRGRLNVLANILGKNPRTIFREFEDKDPEMHRGRGDVKYHLGFSNDWYTETGHKIHLSLAFNPSHLEYVNPVVLGRVRAKQDRAGDSARERGLAILIHGDAAFIGEGVVQETLNMSELPAYRIGGTLHIIVNNQLGFTTAPDQGRSTTYASDIAKMLQAPIFHVNGEDPEAVAQVVELAMEFRKTFRKDVVVDMYCYRRHGHNEGDESSFTQPVMYEKIRQRPTVREAYLERLQALGEITREEADRIAESRREHLEQELSVARSDDFKLQYSAGAGIWSEYTGGADADAEHAVTAISTDLAKSILDRMTTFPDDFQPHPKIERGTTLRAEMAKGERPLDWSTAEALAFGSLLLEGTKIRMTGQDSERGTFSQRHGVLHDVEDGREYVPLNNLEDGQQQIELRNSPLSEIGVLGFEYGYSLDMPEGLVLWEAQFGDFVNSAQVIVDQFIASAEDKWGRLSGLVMLLPHGFEGQGPEHSSARLERFLQLCAEDNIQVVNATTPAQYFHMLRRQVLRPYRKPLVVMTPKSLLRHPKAVSELSELSDASFQRVIPDDLDPQGVTRILLCSGKVYYDLLAKREEDERNDVALIRVEQLYPLSDAEMRDVLEPYAEDAPVLWVQEEPENMGAWRTLRVRWGMEIAGHAFAGVTRPASASPATGSSTTHKLEQAELLREAFGED